MNNIKILAVWGCFFILPHVEILQAVIKYKNHNLEHNCMIKILARIILHWIIRVETAPLGN